MSMMKLLAYLKETNKSEKIERLIKDNIEEI